jgi:hypothetical protein
MLALLAGCAGRHGELTFVIEANRYADAINATRDVLTEARFEVDRVDAQAGIITTHLKPTVGLATPWDGEQSTLGQEGSDLLNQQHRSVTVTFEGLEPDTDLRLARDTLTARVDVVIYRIRTSGWRLETETISRSSFSRDPIAQSRGSPARFAQPLRRDDQLARRLSERIAARLGINATDAAP